MAPEKSPASLASKVIFNASALGIGRLTTAAMGIISVGISTRYLGLGGYGALATALAFSGLVNTLTDIGIWTIAVREMAKRPDDRDAILGATLTAGLALSFFAVVIGAVAAFLIYGGSDEELVRRGILLLLITVPLAAPYGAIGAYFLSLQKAWVGMVGAVAGAVVSLAAVASSAAFDWGFTGVVLAFVASGVVQGAVLVAFSVGRVRIRPSRDLALSRRLFTWSLPLGAAMLVHGLYWRIDIIILSLMSSDSEVALYGLAYRVVDVLVVLPGFVTVTLLPEFARLAGDTQRFREVVGKALAVMQVGALALLVLFGAFASEITQVVGGDNFSQAAPVLRILMVGVALTYSTGVLAQVFIAQNRQHRLLFLTLVLLPVNVLLNIVLIPASGATGAALAFAITEVLHLILLATMCHRFAPLPRPPRLIQTIAAAGCMGLVSLLQLLPFAADASPLIVLAVGMPLCAATYVAALYAFRAMPREIHVGVVLPVLSRIRSSAVPS